MTLARSFLAYPLGNLCNASPEVRTLAPALRPLIPGVRIAGPARTARISPGQNAAIHRAVHRAHPGEVLVVDGGGSDRFGPFGDLLAECCRAQGIVGAVIDGTVRDSADIRTLGFQVFCRGFHAEPTKKEEPGEVDVEIRCAGAVIRPGDIIVADDDGVVAVSQDHAADVLAKAAGVAAREAEIRARILAGETTLEIFGLSAD